MTQGRGIHTQSFSHYEEVPPDIQQKLVAVYTEEKVIEPDAIWMPTSYGKLTGAYRDQMAYFIDCLRQGEQTDIPLEEGLNGVMAAEAIIQSAEKGDEVVLSN